MIKRKYLLLGTVLSVIVLCFSCIAEQRITINTNGSGSLSMVIDLDPALIQYIIDVGEASGKFESAQDAVIFDQAEIRRQLLARPGITIKRLTTPSIGHLELEIGFQNIEQIFSSDKVLAQTKVVTYMRGNTKTLSFHLDKNNFAQILTLFPLFQTEEFKTLLPRENENKEDYFDMIDFALDDGAELVKNTTIKFSVSVNGSIIEQNGGRQQHNTVYFSLPLERLLFLSTPVDYSIKFR